MPIVDGIWISEVEVGLDAFFKGKCDPIMPIPSWDVENIDPSFYRYLAYERNAIAFSPVLDKAHQILALERADELLQHAGTEQALVILGEIACFDYAETFSPNHPPIAGTANTGFSLIVSPCRFEAATAEWQEYVVRVVGELAPVNLPLTSIEIGIDGEEVVYIAGGMVQDPVLHLEGVGT